MQTKNLKVAYTSRYSSSRNYTAVPKIQMEGNCLLYTSDAAATAAAGYSQTFQIASWRGNGLKNGDLPSARSSKWNLWKAPSASAR